MTRIALIGCGKDKLPARAKARHLYTGPLFKKALAFAEANFKHVFILSAEHGLVELDDELDPYDLTVGELDAWERADWGHAVFMALDHRFDTTRPVDLVVFAGEQYADPIRWQLADVPMWDVVEPLKGRGIGQRLQWFNDSSASAAMRGA